jgi:hypothetical protein
MQQAWEEIEPLIMPYVKPAVIILITLVTLTLMAIFTPKLVTFLMYRKYIVTREDWLLVKAVRPHIRYGAYLVLEFDNGDRCFFREPGNCLCIEGDLMPVVCKVNTKNNTASYFYGRRFIAKRQEG